MLLLLFGSAKPKLSLFPGSRGRSARPRAAFTNGRNRFTRTEFAGGRERHLRIRAKFSRSDGQRLYHVQSTLGLRGSGPAARP